MYLAKQDEHIACIGDTEQECIDKMSSACASNYTIEKTEDTYIIYNGKAVLKSEAKKLEEDYINNLTMLSSELIDVLEKLGLTLTQINTLLEDNLEIKMKLIYSQSVKYVDLLPLLPIEVEGNKITKKAILKAFKDKYGL